MKQTILTLALLLCCTIVKANERVVEQPAFNAWSSTSLEIQKIVLSDTATIVCIDAYYSPNFWIKIAQTSYLKAGDRQYPLRYGIGMEPDKEIWMPASGTYSFQMVFPPLPADTKIIDFTEGDFKGAFSIWGIHLDGTSVISALAGRQNPKETPILEEPVLQAGIATLQGRIAGYKPDMKLSGRAWTINVLTGAADEYEIEVLPDGSFKLAVPLLHTAPLNLIAPFMSGQVYLKPGETTIVDINFPEICRSQSKIQKEKPSLGEKFFFTGALAALNNEVGNASIKYLPVGPSGEKEYKQMFADICKMNAEQFKAYWLDRYQRAIAELENHPEISQAYRTLLIQNAGKETAEQLLSMQMIEYAYRQVNKIPRDSALTGFTQPVPTIGYFDFMPKLVPNTPTALYDATYVYLLNAIQYTNFTTDLIQVMGTDKGILFELIAAQKLAQPIKEFKPLTDEELAKAEEISPVMRETLIALNEQTKKAIEENKKKSGYTVNRANISDVPVEELFNAILTPYRGKVVFVDFWATWCGPCKMAMKEAEPVKKEFEGKDIVFLYLAGENSPEGTWKQMIPDIKGEHYRITDAQWKYLCNKYGVQGVPSYMIIAKDGTPAHFQVGFMGADKMREMLQNALGK